MIRLILGGARSGKSRYAERRAAASGLPVTVIATAEAGDPEMAERIARHRAARPLAWDTREEPRALAATLAGFADRPRCLLVDCLTLWLSNVLAAGEADFRRERAALLRVLPELPGETLLVANEIGLGVVPLGESTRRFVDEAGWLNQELAGLADEVVFLAAGLPWFLKGGKEAV